MHLLKEKLLFPVSSPSNSDVRQLQEDRYTNERLRHPTGRLAGSSQCGFSACLSVGTSPKKIWKIPAENSEIHPQNFVEECSRIVTQLQLDEVSVKNLAKN